jgi:putative membrane protein
MMTFEHPPSWVGIVLHLRGSVLARISGRLCVTTVFAVGITILHHQGLLAETLTPTPFALIGVALSIFLGFRNNSSYQRYWEGRILWGRLVNTSRSLTRQILTLVVPKVEGQADEELQFAFVHRLAAYVHALRFHLRNETSRYSELARLLPNDDLQRLAATSNPPISLLHSLAERLGDAWQRGWVDPFHLTVLEKSLSNLTDIQGGCERIKSTPIPFSYTLLIHRIVAVYCLALPFGLVNTTKIATPFVVLLVGYAYFGLDAIGDEIENPFGTDTHDLPLEALSTMIEINIRESLGETDLPAPRTPKSNVLT